MFMKKMMVLICGLLYLSLGPRVLASPQDSPAIKVLSGGAAKTAVTGLAESFRKETGYEIEFVFDTMGGVLKRLGAGEKPDLVIATAEAAADLERAGKLAPGSRRDLGKVQIGVAVKEGAPLPDISTTSALKKTLLAAKSLVYVDPAKGGTSGIHFAKMLARMGIAEQVKSKSILLPGGFVVEAVAKGQAEIGVQQITEILPVKGVKLVGPLPAELQKTTTYTGGLLLQQAPSPGAEALIKYLTGRTGRAGFRAAGFTTD
jgi:molybdate transport system substrate-binding protein